MKAITIGGKTFRLRKLGRSDLEYMVALGRQTNESGLSDDHPEQAGRNRLFFSRVSSALARAYESMAESEKDLAARLVWEYATERGFKVLHKEAYGQPG